MADETPRLKLPFMSTAQVQKELTFNELAAMVDALIQLYIISVTLTAPPAAPSEGDVYVIANGATGVWLGRDQQIAFYVGGWHYVTPQQGWLGYVAADSNYYRYEGGAWVATVTSAVTKLIELTDVSVALPDASVDQFVLTYVDSIGKFALQPVARTLAALDDVSVAAVENGQVLAWDEVQGKYIPFTLPAPPEAGATTFTGLTDTPDDYAGLAGRVLRVNATEDGLEFYIPPTPSKLTDLDDTPKELTGLGGYHLRVNAAETGFDLAPADENPLPPAGATGQVLTKASDADNDVEWKSPASDADVFVALNNQTVDYTLTILDGSGYVRFASDTPVVCTVPANVDVAFPLGSQINLRQVGLGALSVAPASNVTINYPADLAPTARGQHSTLALIKVAEDEWDLTGDMAVL